jgi:hypothetical protein
MTTEILTKELVQIIGGMSSAQRMKMLRDVISLMNERGDPEEIARFLERYLGGDAIEIAENYAERVHGGNWLKWHGY